MVATPLGIFVKNPPEVRQQILNAYFELERVKPDRPTHKCDETQHDENLYEDYDEEHDRTSDWDFDEDFRPCDCSNVKPAFFRPINLLATSEAMQVEALHALYQIRYKGCWVHVSFLRTTESATQPSTAQNIWSSDTVQMGTSTVEGDYGSNIDRNAIELAHIQTLRVSIFTHYSRKVRDPQTQGIEAVADLSGAMCLQHLCLKPAHNFPPSEDDAEELMHKIQVTVRWLISTCSARFVYVVPHAPYSSNGWFKPLIEAVRLILEDVKRRQQRKAH